MMMMMMFVMQSSGPGVHSCNAGDNGPSETTQATSEASRAAVELL